MAMNTTPKLKGSSTGKFDEDWEGTGGCGHVATIFEGISGIPHNRFIPVAKEVHDGAADTTNNCTFTEAENIGQVTITPLSHTGMDATNTYEHDYVLFVVNMTRASAKIALEDTGTLSTDVLYYPVKYGESRTVSVDSSEYISSIDVACTILESGTFTSAIMVEGKSHE